MTCLLRVKAFIESIGIPCAIDEEASGFLSDVAIVDGGLRFKSTASVSSILHEAGHLACLPSNLRAKARGNLKEVLTETSELVLTAPLDSPYFRALVQCSDPEATAWAWAAGVHLGLAPEEIILDSEYDGTGATVRDCLAWNSYLGINGLMHAGFCTVRPNPYKKHLPVYPKLAFWTQPSFDLESGAPIALQQN